MRRLVVLGCSATKRRVRGKMPALDLYDGPMYRVVRSFLRQYHWPGDLSVAVLSAEHGLMGSMTPIAYYDRRMTPERAGQLAGNVKETLEAWQPQHGSVELVLGQDYMGAIKPCADNLWKGKRAVTVAKGPIGLKLEYLSRTLRKGAQKAPPMRAGPPIAPQRPTYFLPDWDDFVDAEFDFDMDKFSESDRSKRNEKHCLQLVAPARLADGILVSLAQSSGGKGLLRALEAKSASSLAPTPVKAHFGLADDQWAFGDCGAFSYVNEDAPTVSVEQAVATYERYGFDLGASVDHIPVPEIVRDGKRRRLSKDEQAARVKLTKANADAFMREWRAREYRFTPVGVVQALTPDGYVQMVAAYAEMGYSRVALGGLVPKSDDDILAIVKAVDKSMKGNPHRPWMHLMGVYRPKLQNAFRELGVDSFDSATYFRKAWLRSDQNYLGADGTWYAAIRVPPSHDPRTAKRLECSGVSANEVARLEKAALAALRAFRERRLSVDRTLATLMEYDGLLIREEAEEKSMETAYRRTLEARPWERCDCEICRDAGIHVLVFRGLNRNKRRGAHNTHMLFRKLIGQGVGQATQGH